MSALLSLVCLVSAQTRIDSVAAADRFLRQSRRQPAQVADFARWYGEDNLQRGTGPRSADLRFVFAVRTEATAKRVEAQADGWKLSLKRIEPGLWAAATTLGEGQAFRFQYRVDGQAKGGGEVEAYTYPPEMKAMPGVPQGQLIPQTPHKSEIFAGTTRQWWLYVPAQYDPSKPACVFVVQDAQWQRFTWKVAMDNLIAKKDIPVSIGIFLTPGVREREWDNRSVEFDTVSDRYVSMLEKEILPNVEARYNLRKDARGRLIAGASSGAICAFTAAWHRPDLFHKVVSWIGSYTNLQGGPSGYSGGNTYPAQIRKLRGWDRSGAPKPIRVFLQDGRNDLDNAAGNWPLANQDMAKALEYGGYDFKFVMGNGFHSDRHGQVLLPDTLRWMWRDEPKG